MQKVEEFTLADPNSYPCDVHYVLDINQYYHTYCVLYRTNHDDNTGQNIQHRQHLIRHYHHQQHQLKQIQVKQYYQDQGYKPFHNFSFFSAF